MDSDNVDREHWPHVLQILLKSNSVVNALAEPQVVLDELMEDIPGLNIYLSNPEIEKDKKQLTCNEIARQLQYMGDFGQKLKNIEQTFRTLCDQEAAK